MSQLFHFRQKVVLSVSNIHTHTETQPHQNKTKVFRTFIISSSKPHSFSFFIFEISFSSFDFLDKMWTCHVLPLPYDFLNRCKCFIFVVKRIDAASLNMSWCCFSCQIALNPFYHFEVIISAGEFYLRNHVPKHPSFNRYLSKILLHAFAS